MRGEKAKRPPTPPSEDEGEENFVADPDQIFDDLPQPFRLVDKVLRKIFDDAWDIIEDIEEKKALRRSKTVLPLFDLGKELSEYSKTTCVCIVANGSYLFLSCNKGLTVLDGLLGTTVACIEDTGNNIIQMSTCCLQDGYYLAATLDNMGFARLYCFAADKVVLVKTFNEQDGVNKQSVATFVEMSQDGSYIGIGWEVATRESWLEIYSVPKETWIKEMEAALMTFAPSRKATMDSIMDTEDPPVADLLVKPAEDQGAADFTAGSRPSSAQGSQTQPGQSAVSFTKPVTVLRVRPPAPVGPCAATNCSAALKVIDTECNVIGSGANHVLMSQYFENCNKAFQRTHSKEMKYLINKDEAHCTRFPRIHFLTPGRLIPSGLESTPSKVNSLSVWWSSGTQLFFYSLVKTAKDLEHKPDIVWPNSDQIIMSAISECGSFMALGLKDGTVIVWDIYRGTLLRVYPITDKGRILVLCFLPSDVVPLESRDGGRISSSSASHAKLVVSCDDGTFCLLQCAVAYTPAPKPLVDKSAVDTEVIVSVTKIPSVPQVIVTVKRSGAVTMYDVINCTAICHVGLQDPFFLSPHFPCICADGKILVLIGAQLDKENEDALDQETAVPFCFSLQSFPTLKEYWKEDVSTTPPYKIRINTVDARLHSLIKQRVVSQEKRQLRLEQRWSQFKTELKNIQKNKTRRNHSVWLTSKAVN